MVNEAAIRSTLDGIDDPELPCSLIQLGLVESVAVQANHVAIELMPTFTGCPALAMIEDDVRASVMAMHGVTTCDVTWVYTPAWTAHRITAEGQARLKLHGVTTPHACGGSGVVQLQTSAVPCPYCGSADTRLDSPYGPTRCRQIHFCVACRNQFEHMKGLERQ
jgi:ring-1,2-phenylacetyl-CoA epoxidase subunit PaaD